jgi:hypothetical protein
LTGARHWHIVDRVETPLRSKAGVICRIALSAALLVMTIALTGCNDVQKQRTMAVAASQRFLSLYNNDACQQVYDEASHYFQAHETRSRWLRDCDEIRNCFGSWSAFVPTSNNGWGIGRVGVVWVRGPARFTSSAADVRLDWDLTPAQAALSNILIDQAGGQTSIPGFTGEIRN